MKRPSLALAAGLATLLATAALAAPPILTGDSAKGPILTDAAGMTLYTFDKDQPDSSACYDACASNWPPLLAGAADQPEGAFGIIPRKDGSRQWTHGGMPLYTWVKDAKPGDISGDGVKEVWHLARP